VKKFTRWLAARLIQDHGNVDDPKVRASYGTLEGSVSIAVNAVLFAIKIFVGLSIGSVSLIADAIHTLADCATSVVIIVGFKMARKPSDREHPFGHGKMEPVVTLVVAVLLTVSAVELLEKSVHSVISPAPTFASSWIILLIVGTIIVKELMAVFSFELGVMIDSEALKADALHHRSDVLATSLVVIALIASRFEYYWVDGVMGVMVSLIIVLAAYMIAKDAINPLLGEAPSRDKLEAIERIARQHKGVLGVHDIIYNKYGQTSIVSLHLEVSDKESLFEAHAMSEEVEEQIVKNTGGTVVVHLDPINIDHPQYASIAQAISEIIANDARLHSFHDLRIIGSDPEKCSTVFDVALEESVDEGETYDIIRSVKREFRKAFPKMKTVVKADPRYAYNP
jgi:cation diffusion facilitator family transporter